MALARNEEELQEITRRMRDYVTPFVTPLFYEDAPQEDRRPGGTGNFICVGDGVCILTNCHVVRDKIESLLAYFIGDGYPARAIGAAYSLLPPPVDFGIARISADFSIGGEKTPLPLTEFGCSENLEGDLYFVQGFPERGPNGQIITFYSALLGAQAQPVGFTTIFRSYEGENTFDIDFPYEGFISQEMTVRHMGNPGGFSGSLVWKCNFSPNSNWSPSEARVVGLVKKWDPDRHTLMCTRVELLGGFLTKFALNEAAYYRWHNNGRPEGRALEDWLWAEQNQREILSGTLFGMF